MKHMTAQKWLDERMIWNAVMVGTDYHVDNTSLFQLIERCCIGTDAESWIHEARRTKNGYQAIQALCLQYNGPNMIQKQKTWAEQQLQSLYYKSEKTAMRFDRFVTCLKDAFDIMADCGVAYPEAHKIPTLFNKVRQCLYIDVTTVVSVLHTATDKHLQTFDSVASQISEAVIMSYINANDSTQTRRDRREVHAVGTAGRGGQGCGGHGGCGGRGGRGGRGERKIVNGVDVTSLTRWYSNKEFRKLPPDVQTQIKQAKAEQKRKTSSTSVSVTDAQRAIHLIQTILAGQTDDMSELPNQTTGPTHSASNTAASSNPGDAFGRQAYSV